MKKLKLLFILGVFLSNVALAQNIELEDVQPQLTSTSAIMAFYEMNDIAYYKDIVNTPKKALIYVGDKKVAANMGVYLADMNYGIGAKALKANESFSAVMELSKKLGLEKQFTQVILDRLNNENISATEASELLDRILKDSKNKFSEAKQTEIYNFLLFGNYIEKLYLVSSVLSKSLDSDLPEAVKSNLNRSLLILMAKQGKPLEELSKLMVDYSSELVAHRDIQGLLKLYKQLAANKDKIVNLAPADIYKNKNITDIQKNIETIRARIVE